VNNRPRYPVSGIETLPLLETSAISSTAVRNARSFACEGLVNPVIFRTNWSDAARTSSEVTGGSKLKSGLMFLHMIERLHE
jgi:hypothetical protein